METIGKIKAPDGEFGVKAFLGIKRDGRDIKFLDLEDGSYGIVIDSKIPKNDGEEVNYRIRLTEETLVMLMEAIHLGTMYFGVDLNAKVAALSDDGNVYLSCGGNGEFKA